LVALLPLAADEPKRDGKAETPKDEQLTGKIAESQKRLRDRKVRSEPTKIMTGVYILEVTAGGPATAGREKPKDAGDIVMLEEGDIITHIDGKQVKTAEEYYKLMSGSGEKKITVVDVNTDKTIVNYFKPVDGQLMIKFEILSPPLG
jgi:S1-C subfamily serine protease